LSSRAGPILWGLERLAWKIILQIAAAALVSGVACSVAGFFLANLRLPFLGVTMSHAAMAGAVFGRLFGLPVFPPAFVTSIAASFAIGPLADRARLDANVAMAIIFSLTMGLAFLGIGITEGPKTEMLGLIWGSVLLIQSGDLVLLLISGILLIGFAVLFESKIKAVLFSRTISAASGVPERFITYTLLILSGAVITASLETVGGLLLFALLVNPVAAASRVFTSYRWNIIGSALLGAVSALGGLSLSWFLDLPAGASIVLVSGLVFVISWGVGRK